MENKVKKTSPKAQTLANKSMNKIAKTAKNINTEVAETVETVMADVKKSRKDITIVAKQSMVAVSDKMNTTKSVNKIKATAAKVNAQIQETVNEVLEDVKASSKEMQANTIKMATEAIENINITERVEGVKKAVKNTNEYALETAEELVDSMLTNSEKWQNVATKAVKTGFKIAEKQQDMMFTTLEAVKEQLGTSAIRLRNMFKNN